VQGDVPPPGRAVDAEFNYDKAFPPGTRKVAALSHQQRR
jgi:hypothetical protein